MIKFIPGTIQEQATFSSKILHTTSGHDSIKEQAQEYQHKIKTVIEMLGEIDEVRN